MEGCWLTTASPVTKHSKQPTRGRRYNRFGVTDVLRSVRYSHRKGDGPVSPYAHRFSLHSSNSKQYRETDNASQGTMFKSQLFGSRGLGSVKRTLRLSVVAGAANKDGETGT